MKIKILTSCAGIKFSYVAGQMVDASDRTARDLIKAGYAENVKESESNKPSGGKTHK